MTTNPFHEGDLLIVTPSNGDDPDATKHSGHRCKFIRYADAPGKLSRYAVVKFSEKGQPLYMREQDLERTEQPEP